MGVLAYVLIIENIFYGLLNSNNIIIVKLMIKFIRSLLNMRETLI